MEARSLILARSSSIEPFVFGDCKKRQQVGINVTYQFHHNRDGFPEGRESSPLVGRSPSLTLAVPVSFSRSSTQLLMTVGLTLADSLTRSRANSPGASSPHLGWKDTTPDCTREWVSVHEYSTLRSESTLRSVMMRVLLVRAMTRPKFSLPAPRSLGGSSVKIRPGICSIALVMGGLSVNQNHSRALEQLLTERRALYRSKGVGVLLGAVTCPLKTCVMKHTCPYVRALPVL